MTLIHLCEHHVMSVTPGTPRFSGNAIKFSLKKLSPYMLIYRTKQINIKRNGMNTGIGGKYAAKYNLGQINSKQATFDRVSINIQP